MPHQKFITPDCRTCVSRNASLFGCCGDRELDQVNAAKQCQAYKKGQLIFQEGNRPAGLHVIYSGKVKVTKLGGDGKEQIIRLAKPGDLVGYRALIAETNYSASAVALDDCTVCMIPKHDFQLVIQQNIQISNGLMKLLSTTLGNAETRMLQLAYKPVRERLAEALLLLQSTYEPEKSTEPFSIAISREDLASIVGTVKETCIRLLAELKDEGIICTKGSNITLLEPEKLYEITHLYD